LDGYQVIRLACSRALAARSSKVSGSRSSLPLTGSLFQNLLMPCHRKEGSTDSSLPPFDHAAVERAEHKLLHAVRV
jgi:hypothetical protein